MMKPAFSSHEPEETLLECQNLSFSYSNSDHPAVLHNLNLKIRAGTLVHIQGVSGAGKSTFLRLLNRLEEPCAGAIHFKGRPLSAYPPCVLRRNIAFVQQTPALTDGSVRKNLTLPFSFRANRDLPFPLDEDLAAYLKDFQLEDVKLTDTAANLSGGQRQRLCLLRAILLRPEVLLLDEPFSALDPASRDAVQEVIVNLNQTRGLTIVLVSHQPFHYPELAPVAAVIKDGRIWMEPS